MNKVNMILGAALVVQVLLIVLFASPFGGAESTMIERTSLFDGVDADSVLGLRITEMPGKPDEDESVGEPKEKTIELRKSDGEWVLASAGDYPVKEDKVTAVLEKVLDLKGGRPVTRKSKNYVKLEVSDDKFQRKVELFGDAGRDLGVLFIGSSPNYNLRNVRRRDNNEVFLASGISPWELSTSRSQWVDTTWLELPRDEITSLSIRHGEVSIAVARGEDGGWKMSSPRETSVPKDKIDPILRGFEGIYLSEPIGRGEDSQFGFDSPEAEVELIVTRVKEKPAGEEPGGGEEETAEPETETQTYRIVVGSKREAESDYYVKSSESDFVVTMSSYAVESKFLKKVEDFIAEEPEEEAGADEETEGQENDE